MEWSPSACHRNNIPSRKRVACTCRTTPFHTCSSGRNSSSSSKPGRPQVTAVNDSARLQILYQASLLVATARTLLTWSTPTHRRLQDWRRLPTCPAVRAECSCWRKGQPCSTWVCRKPVDNKLASARRSSYLVQICQHAAQLRLIALISYTVTGSAAQPRTFSWLLVLSECHRLHQLGK